MAKIDDEAPLEQNYEILGTAIERTLTKLQLAVEQRRHDRLQERPDPLEVQAEKRFRWKVARWVRR